MKNLITLLLLAGLSTYSFGVSVEYEVVNVNGCSGFKFFVADSAEYPGYYMVGTQMPSEGYSYFWITDEGNVSQAKHPTFYFHSSGSHDITLVLTPRKKPGPVPKVIEEFSIQVDANQTSTCSNGNVEDAPIYLESEPKTGDTIYAIIPLNSCKQNGFQDYTLNYSTISLTSPRLVYSQFSFVNINTTNGEINFSKEWHVFEEDLNAIVEFVVTGDVGDDVLCEFINSNSCQNNSLTKVTIEAGPYDPNKKVSDVDDINVYLDGNRKVQPTTVEYTIHFQNIGEGPVDSITITDELPDYLTYVGTTGSSHDMNISPEINGSQITWIVGNHTNSRANIRGTNEFRPKPIPSTKGWISFECQIAPANQIPIPTDTCYCLCNVATIYFNELDPIKTKADIIAIGDSLCFSNVDGDKQKDLYSNEICRNPKKYYETLSAQRFDESEKSGVMVTVYPNPTTSHITLSDAEFHNTKFELINAQGQRLSSGTTGNGIISLEQFPKGIYYINIQTTSGNYSANIIKR